MAHVHGSGSVPDGVSPDGRGHQRRLMATLALTGSVFVAEVVGAIVTEGIFNINGVGGTVFRAVKLGEGPTVVSFVAVMVIIFMLANLLVDLLYAVLDPRIRYA